MTGKVSSSVSYGGHLHGSLYRMVPVLVLWLAVALTETWAVDRGNFKTCDQSAFCK